MTTAVHRNYNFPTGRPVLMNIGTMFYQQNIFLGTPDHPFGNRANQAVFNRAKPQSPHDNQVIRRFLDITHQLSPVTPLKGFTDKRNLQLLTFFFGDIQVGIADDLHPFGDQLIMNISLPF